MDETSKQEERMKTNDGWPEEDVLRAILKLPGVSGQTMSEIEDYLDDIEMSLRFHEAEKDFPGAAYRPMHELRRSLHAAVNAHWSQLCEAGAV
jgi:hypothetical protein